MTKPTTERQPSTQVILSFATEVADELIDAKQNSTSGEIMTRLIPGFAILTLLLPFTFCGAQTLDVLPDELAPGAPKTEMMAVWLKTQAMVALDRRDAAFEKLTNEELTT